MNFNLIFFFAVLSYSSALWQCTLDSDCGGLDGGVCASSGECACPAGRQPVDGGTRCLDGAPYYLSPCVEDFQCERLSMGYHCSNREDGVGECVCRPGFHYFLGRCWQTRDFGEACSLQQECLSMLRDPFSLDCVEGVCTCAEGYYLRQRGECRKIAHGVGEECVLDADCQFENGACDYWDLVCYDVSVTTRDVSSNSTSLQASSSDVTATNTRQLDLGCSNSEECGGFLTCSAQRHCVCPAGYFRIGNSCFSELGSPVRPEAACPGVFTVSDDICRCPNNFFYEEHMRDCIKATVRFGDSCTADENCWTFGSAGICGPEQGPWELRECECNPEMAVLDTELNICRLFSALGEQCETESDCLAGELQVLCVPDNEGVHRCSCPEHLEQEDGLCITRGLELGDPCQVSAECGSQHSECADGVCSCTESYVQIDDSCQSAIGGECNEDSDCVIDNTSCQTVEEKESCQCVESYVQLNQTCLPAADGHGAPCSESVQCVDSLGEGSDCAEGLCSCLSTHHYRGNSCRPITRLLERCTRTPECYLSDSEEGDISERVECRNDFCQCRFIYPHSEELNTCLGSAGSRIALPSLLIFVVTFVLVNFS